METFANSRFWRVIAVALVVLLAVDVGLRLFERDALPPVFPVARAAADGGIVWSATEGFVTTNQDGTIVHRWGRLDSTAAGAFVTRFDVNKLEIDRLDLK